MLLWLLAGGQGEFDRISRQAAEARQQEQIPAAIDLYRRAVGLRPAWSEGWWYLGALLYDQDQYAAARDALRKLVAVDPKAGAAFGLLGLCEYKTKEYERALADINQGRRLGLGNDAQAKRVVLYHAALLYTRFQQYESALQILEKVTRLGAMTPDLITACGLAGLRRPLAPEDVAASERDLITLAGKAACAAAARNPGQAKQEFAILLERYPKAPNVHYLYGSFLAATDAEAALREFEKELEVNPQSVDAMVTIALLYEQRAEPDRALPLARRAVETDPKFFAAHGVLGRLLVNAGELEKGLKELQIAEKQAPDSPQVHFSLATAYGLAGRKEDAGRERAEFLRLRQLADETSGK